MRFIIMALSGMLILNSLVLLVVMVILLQTLKDAGASSTGTANDNLNNSSIVESHVNGELLDRYQALPTDADEDNRVVRVVPQGGTVWEEVSDQLWINDPQQERGRHELRVLAYVRELKAFGDPSVVVPGFAFRMEGMNSGYVRTHPVECAAKPGAAAEKSCW